MFALRPAAATLPANAGVTPAAGPQLAADARCDDTPPCELPTADFFPSHFFGTGKPLLLWHGNMIFPASSATLWSHSNRHCSPSLPELSHIISALSGDVYSVSCFVNYHIPEGQ